MLLHQFLEQSGEQQPDKVAIIHDSDRITYGVLKLLVARFAGQLRANGIVKGDRIVVLLENSIDYVIAYYAILKVGAVVTPLDPGLKPEGLQYLIDDLEPAAVIANFKCERLLKAVTFGKSPLKLLVIGAPKLQWGDVSVPVLTFQECLADAPVTIIRDDLLPSDLASIIYTSGSTGRPKGVMLSHGNIVSNTKAICQSLSLTQSDIQMVVLPFFYVMGKSLLNTHVAAAATIVINNRFLYPADVVKQMIDEQVTSFSGVPSTYAYLLNRSPLASCRDKLNALRYCSQAGGHMAATLKRSLRRALPDHTQIYIMYGATEASARLTSLDPAFFESKIESVGKPIFQVTIRILDDQGCEVPAGMEGELVASGPNIMQGYWKNPQETARALSVHGYHTGDIGYSCPEGFFYIVRRKDGLLKVGGHRINPIEIEDYLIATDQLIEIAVVPVPDPLSGNKLIALAVPKEEKCSASTLLKQCAAGLANHKRPAKIVLVRNLPKNTSGKIDREQCIEIAKGTLSSMNMNKKRKP